MQQIKITGKLWRYIDSFKSKSNCKIAGMRVIR